MAIHVIVGAGPVGSATAGRLAASGHQVRVITRSGSGPVADNIERVAADASNVERLGALVQGAAALYNCANPPYQRWVTDWPPLAGAVLGAAERSGAVLVIMSNLYAYGPIDHPMTEADPLRSVGRKGRVRAEMWETALAAHRAGRARVVEARASDYFGAGVRETSHVGQRTIPRVLQGRSIRVLGDPRAPHSWTYVPDIASALVTLATDDQAWGRAWHVPTNSPMSQREFYMALARIAGAPAPKVKALPPVMLRIAGAFVPLMRELQEVRYQFDRPFVIDSSAFEDAFGLRATPMDDALTVTVAWWREQGRAPA